MLEYKNRPFVRCKHYETANQPEFKRLSYLVLKRENGDLDLRNCQECCGYNSLCEVYKESNNSDQIAGGVGNSE